MNRQITIGQYRTIDLCILSVVLAVCQYLTHVAASFWFPDQLYVVSPVAGMTALVMMRWNGYGAIPAALGGVIYVFLSGGSFEQMLIFTAGNLVSMAALVMFRIWDKEKIRTDSVLTVSFGIAVQLLMQLGRAGLAILLGYPAAACIGFITTDLLSVLFTVFIVWTVRRIEGLFEDQKHYLLRLASEQEN